ncbi:hypothetical protein ACWEWX_08055 [Streptomyces asiaticus]
MASSTVVELSRWQFAITASVVLVANGMRVRRQMPETPEFEAISADVEARTRCLSAGHREVRLARPSGGHGDHGGLQRHQLHLQGTLLFF